MSNEDKKEKRRDIKRKLREDERQRQLGEIPLSEAVLRQLFDYVDSELKNTDCDHTLRYAIAFLEKSAVTHVDEVISWLNENGGYCDCEVIANVEQAADEIFYNEYHSEPRSQG